jgi:glycerol-3-phosphate O-acyltransferase
VSDVLGTPAFGELLRALSQESGRPIGELRSEAESDLKEMAARPGHYSVAAWDRFCRWLSRAYNVDYRADEARALRRLNQTTTLIFLPNHRSYLDTLVLRSALMDQGFPPNNVIAGANLALWPLSTIGQRNGIVFIRREFRDDHLYRAVLRTYLAHLIEERQNLEWYIEGGRTRTGKLRPPRLGVLSYIMDAFEENPDHDVNVVPTAIVYDQQHEVSAISAEETGGSKKGESFSWLYNFARDQSRRLGRAYVRFGEPLSLREAVALTVDEDGLPRPRLAVPKVAIEVSNRINAVTPITPAAMITFALLDNGDRAITVHEGRLIINPLMDYIRARRLPMIEELDVARPAVMRETLERLVGEGVVSHDGDGDDDIYWVELAKHHEAAFYRNTMVHFFVARAITELAALGAAEEGAEDINSATWLRARRLKDLLRFEFFFPTTLEFAGEVAAEIRLIYPEWEGESFTADDVLQRLGGLQLILAHRVIGAILEAYRVLAEELALLGDQPADESALVERSLKVAHQRWLRKMLPTAESISRDYFRNAAKVAAKLGLFDAETEDLAQQREAFAAELRETGQQLDQLRRIAQAAGQPVLAQRATR